MTLNVLTENSFKNEFERKLVRIEVTDGQLMQTSSQLFLAIYVQKKSSTLTYIAVLSSESVKKPPPLKNQSPTDCIALIHILSVHGQCQLWKGTDKLDPPVVDICVHGWEMKDGVTTQDIYPAPSAPPKLLDMVSCQCGKQSNKTCTTGRCSWLICACDCVNMEKMRMKRKV